MIEGWYYLHTNGDLIYKHELGETAADLRESDFVRALWPVDPTYRRGAWNLLVEAFAAGADRSRILELAAKWKCDDEDAREYSARVGCRLFRDGDAWCATRVDFINLQESPAGFGESCLEAMGALCKELGYQPSKMWGTDFEKLVTDTARKTSSTLA